MEYKLEITDRAHDDLDEILTYISDTLCAPMAAANLIKSFEDCYDLLKSNPLIYPVSIMPKLAKKKIRRAPVKNYLVLYNVDKSASVVYIYRIVYGARNYIELI